MNAFNDVAHWVFHNRSILWTLLVGGALLAWVKWRAHMRWLRRYRWSRFAAPLLPAKAGMSGMVKTRARRTFTSTSRTFRAPA
jgi:hypothetical protein